jgi:hypothetical protein
MVLVVLVEAVRLVRLTLEQQGLQTLAVVEVVHGAQQRRLADQVL